MNEQLIGDLFAEATRRMTGSSSKEFSQKFSELIVRECVEQLRQEWYELNNTESDTLGDARAVAILVGQKNGVLKTIARVKQHFGVEE